MDAGFLKAAPRKKDGLRSPEAPKAAFLCPQSFTDFLKKREESPAPRRPPLSGGPWGRQRPCWGFWRRGERAAHPMPRHFSRGALPTPLSTSARRNRIRSVFAQAGAYLHWPFFHAPNQSCPSFSPRFRASKISPPAESQTAPPPAPRPPGKRGWTASRGRGFRLSQTETIILVD